MSFQTFVYMTGLLVVANVIYAFAAVLVPPMWYQKSQRMRYGLNSFALVANMLVMGALLWYWPPASLNSEIRTQFREGATQQMSILLVLMAIALLTPFVCIGLMFAIHRWPADYAYGERYDRVTTARVRQDRAARRQAKRAPKQARKAAVQAQQLAARIQYENRPPLEHLLLGQPPTQQSVFDLPTISQLADPSALPHLPCPIDQLPAPRPPAMFPYTLKALDQVDDLSEPPVQSTVPDQPNTEELAMPVPDQADQATEGLTVEQCIEAQRLFELISQELDAADATAAQPLTDFVPPTPEQIADAISDKLESDPDCVIQPAPVVVQPNAEQLPGPDIDPDWDALFTELRASFAAHNLDDSGTGIDVFEALRLLNAVNDSFGKLNPLQEVTTSH